MRVFDDESGNRWQAAVAFGSYGAAQLVFARMDGDELRIAAIEGETLQAAERRLEEFADGTLRDRLQAAEPWQ